ncbi:quinone-interacting membrane-bound oxidoreductase complex subunit QmoC [bacterium]|nr:quinone-interacting membrane-bound oxidoreductase complex subunit QmoC [bacterium]
MSTTTVMKPDLEFIRDLKKAGGDTLKKCYQCATCSVVCNLSSKDHPFPRKQMVMSQWGMKDQLLGDPSIWMCHQCMDCTKNCPRDAKPGEVLGAVRAYAFQHFAFPAFMGKALANRNSLPVLLLIPAMVLLGVLLGGSSGDWGYLFQFTGEVELARAFPHGALEMLFIGGNLLIFAFAAVGLMRFWKGLKAFTPGKSGPGFIPAFIAAITELLTHKKFNDCEETKHRYLGHTLMFWGFIGAMATAGFAVFFTIILESMGSPFYLHSPIDLPNPIKILGVVSGIAMIWGGWILIQKRKSEDAPGVSSYSDWQFLYMIWFVGLTGMLTYILRLAGIPIVGYAVYYVHLVLVFFLLWYAPYSKFGHMFYRTLALIYAKSVAIDNPRKK